MQLLEQHVSDFTIIEYLKKPLSKEEILHLSKRLDKRPKEFIRKSEPEYKNNNIASYLEDDNKLAGSIEKFPKIMERPIFVNGEKAVVGRPPENILTLLDE